jgi:hypothetical protein
MKKTLQDQYLLIKEGKGHKDIFLKEAKLQFPNIVRNAATFEEAAASLKTKNIINENVIGISAINSPFESKKKESFETAFENFLAEAKKKKEEDEKAELKKPSKQVEKDLDKMYDRTDDKLPDNLIFDQIMMGYYAELKDPKNADKTMQQLKDIVLKNLAKDPIHYTKDGQFGVKGLGYATEAPGLGTPKEATGKYKSSGYGNLNESIGRNYPGELEGEYEGELQKIYGFDIYDNLKDILDISNSEEDFINKVTYSLTDETSTLPKSSEDKLRIWYKNNTSSLGEVKLRKVIREIINIELKEFTQNEGAGPASFDLIKSKGGGGGKRYIPTEAFLSQDTIDKFNFSNPGENAPTRAESLQIPHIKFLTKPEGSIMLISNFLYNAMQGLERGRSSREKEMGKNELEKLISDIDPMVRALIKKNVDPKMTFGNYHAVNMPIEREKGIGVKIPLSKEEKEELEEMMLRESLLKEGVEKELAEINKEAEHEVLESKLQKVTDAIERRQSQLSRLDEDEDMKNLTDKKKVKELEKDIKTLEKAKAKLEKMMSKSKGKKKEVIDEDEPMDDTEISEDITKDVAKNVPAFDKINKSVEDITKNVKDWDKVFENEGLAQETIDGVTEKYDAILEKNGEVTDQEIEKIADDYPFEEKAAILDYLSDLNQK